MATSSTAAKKSAAGSKSEKNIAEEKNFEEALSELEAIVSSLEKGELSLEESMEAYEQGIKLTAGLNGRLKAAKLKIEELKASE